MGDVEAVETVVTAILSGLAVTVFFIVPGYLFQTSYLRGRRRRQTGDQVFLARTVAGAVLIHALALPWTLHWTGRIRDGGEAGSWELAAWALVVLLAVPVLAGSALASVSRLRRPRRLADLLDRIGLADHIRVPDAWQWHFGRRRPAYVRVHLKDDRTLLGYLGSRSFASSDSAHRDLYLQRQYRPRDGKVFGPAVANTAGVWISGDEIAFIEFFEQQQPPKPDSEGAPQ